MRGSSGLPLVHFARHLLRQSCPDFVLRRAFDSLAAAYLAPGVPDRVARLLKVEMDRLEERLAPAPAAAA